MTDRSTSSSSGEDLECNTQSEIYMESMRGHYDMLLQQGERMRIKLRKFKDLQKDACMWTQQIQNDTKNNTSQYKEYEPGAVATSDFQIDIMPYQGGASLEIFELM